MTEELKLCPFCGSTADVKSVNDGWNVECHWCGATSKIFRFRSSDAIEAWNNRPFETAEDKQEKAMTNLDYIKTLTLDQMKEFLSLECFDWCIHHNSPECLTADCKEGIKAWLQKPLVIQILMVYTHLITLI
jgi:Lar family restriction alleviation protein